MSGTVDTEAEWPDSLRQVLVLTERQEDYEWLSELFGCTQENIQLSRCHRLEACEDLLQRNVFDLVIWNAPFAFTDPASHELFLNLLLSAGGDSPILVLGDAPEEEAVAFWKSLGASDYLCRTRLTGWSLVRACRSVWLAGPAEDQVRSGPVRNPQSVTGVDRARFFDILERAMRRCDEAKQRLALFHVNVDDFRAFNEALGYQAGDQILALLAERVKTILQEKGQLIRIGGDDLAVVVEAIDNGFDTNEFVIKLADALNAPFEVAGRALLVTVSIGIAIYPEAGATVDGLTGCANRAMFEAKRDTGTSHRYFSSHFAQAGGRQLQLEAELRDALRKGELELHFQPRVLINGRGVAGVECLLRWNHPVRGRVAPDEFIPAAERSGLIVPIGYWVIEQACMRLREAAVLGYSELVFAVNLSFRQFHDRRMTDTMFRIIYNANIDTRLLELELTESAMMHDPDYAQRCLRELHSLGLSFALDDFGTGFSSLSHLQNLPISLVKIDKSFVQRVESDEDAQHIVSAIISLSHSLRKKVVAEGVETAGQLAFLSALKCDQIQGYYYARPMPWADLLDYLEGPHRIIAARRGGH